MSTEDRKAAILERVAASVRRYYDERQSAEEGAEHKPRPRWKRRRAQAKRKPEGEQP